MVNVFNDTVNLLIFNLYCLQVFRTFFLFIAIKTVISIFFAITPAIIDYP